MEFSVNEEQIKSLKDSLVPFAISIHHFMDMQRHHIIERVLETAVHNALVHVVDDVNVKRNINYMDGLYFDINIKCKTFECSLALTDIDDNDGYKLCITHNFSNEEKNESDEYLALDHMLQAKHLIKLDKAITENIYQVFKVYPFIEVEYDNDNNIVYVSNAPEYILKYAQTKE